MYSNYLIVEILSYINKNLYKKISINELEKTFNYNKDYIMRLFKREIGITIIEYINIKRIYNSTNLLVNTDYSILKIAIFTGFFSQEYFSEIFKKYIGVSPSCYRKFYFRDLNISNNTINLINNKIASIVQILKKSDNYLINTPPKKQVKILSIFK